ncbi:polysialyltransferase family glycosyltransferase [Pseudomonas sp. GV071]|uniref:polysialyltransferase family glycosyltransferase n=1 Tax=Pseudomonas sp. GV071 TaxID=2135754 RepID=UPI000D3CA93F|nr:polysialyltransferase family glycosyltransferase [Pseudomonas sp. GV071]PTQ71035.1 hypothetical protein C8K61_105172 [Pseudomonas sp. GV071]
MLDNTVNPWATKARALDQYRWLLLRERHGVVGSAVRFAREALADWWFGVRAKRRLAERGSGRPCDVLLLQSAPKVIAFQRKKMLIEALRQSGHDLVETSLQEPGATLSKRELMAPPYSVPTRYFGIAAHAEWLVAHYQPRVLLNDRNGSLYSPFLRLSLNQRQRPLVHLAHATTVEASRRLGMIDYDYYLLFGKSSEEALQRRALRFGTTTALLTGSHMISPTFDLPPAAPSLKTLLVLGVGPDKEKEPGYQQSYQLIRDWAAGHPQQRVLIKGHPRSKMALWQEAASKLGNIEVLPASTSLESALASASIVISLVSNAVIEAALARRPVVHINTGGFSDIFEQERFFGPALKTAAELDQRIAEIEAHYPDHVEQSNNFAVFHLAGGFLGLERTVAVINALVEGASLPAEIEGIAMAGTC